LSAFDSSRTIFRQGFHGIPDLIDEIKAGDRSISNSYFRDSPLSTQQENSHERKKARNAENSAIGNRGDDFLNQRRICEVLITRGPFFWRYAYSEYIKDKSV
jgi:hypothetical protein